MAEFNLKCQLRYPKKCELPIAEKERLEGSEKYKAFFMYQVYRNDEYLKEALREYFKAPLYFLYDSDDIRGLGVKFCKICKLAQASDFGIAVLSPENENVFMEIGLLIGLGKPCLYIVNENNLKEKDIKKLPFDISDQIVIKYDSRDKLLNELEREVPIFMIKVQSIMGYEKALRDGIKERLGRLSPKGKDILRKFISLGEIEIFRNEAASLLGIMPKKPEDGAIIEVLQRLKFINLGYDSIYKREIYSIEKAYRSILQELLFNE